MNDRSLINLLHTSCLGLCGYHSHPWAFLPQCRFVVLLCKFSPCPMRNVRICAASKSNALRIINCVEGAVHIRAVMR